MQKASLLLTVLLLFTGTLLMAGDTKRCTCKEPELTLGVFLTIASFGAAAGLLIAAAPISAIPAAAGTVTAKIIAMSTVSKVGLGLTIAQAARPYVVQTTEEKLNVLLKEKASRPTKTSADLINCLKSNRRTYPRDKSGIPVACEGQALFYAIDSGVPALKKKTEAFKNGKCFCSDHL